MSFNAPDINQFKVVGSTVGDVYFPRTKLLLPLNGTNGATTTSDLSNSNYTVTFVGNAEISTAQSKFGGSSLYVADGNDYLVSSGSQQLRILNGSLWTMEVWVYFDFNVLNSIASSGHWVTFMKLSGGAGAWNGTNGHSVNVFLYNNGGNKVLYVQTPNASNSCCTAITSTLSGLISDQTWHHIAVTGNAGTLTLYVDGVSKGSSSSGMGNPTSDVMAYLGDSGGYSSGMYFNDYRVSRGIVRYTSNFTAPTTAHLTSAGDVNKQIIINSTADGVAIGTGGINQARIAKAWCNINGTGTISIRGSYNVSSLTDVGTGKYKVNFSTAMTDSNYVGFCAGAEVDSGTNQNHLFHLKRETPLSDILNTAYIYVASANTANTATDDGLFCVIVFGN